MSKVKAGRDVTFTVEEMTALASAMNTMLDAYKTVSDVMQTATARSFGSAARDELAARRALRVAGGAQ
ncbi:hypothetical protein ABZU32_20320 [Sphaerisporangium sp. NPDC005288]|uniref:hypothetical protein n=1 Tax=Sphaerisporangium sp. NPDC005288 TaxID=3155114 RepID=UPI0033BDB707